MKTRFQTAAGLALWLLIPWHAAAEERFDTSTVWPGRLERYRNPPTPVDYRFVETAEKKLRAFLVVRNTRFELEDFAIGPDYVRFSFQPGAKLIQCRLDREALAPLKYQGTCPPDTPLEAPSTRRLTMFPAIVSPASSTAETSPRAPEQEQAKKEVSP